MKKRITTTTAAFLLGLATFTQTAHAAPMQRAHVAEQALWYAHVDLDLFKRTQVGQYILTLLERPEDAAKLAAFEAIFQFNLAEDLNGITLYGNGEEEKGVMLLDGTFNNEHLITLIRGGENYAQTAHRSHTIHRWPDGYKVTEKDPKPPVFGAIHPNGLIILADAQAYVAQALDVLDGMQPSLAASTKLAIPDETVTNSYLIGAGKYTDIAKINPRAAILQKAEMLGLAVGESGGVVTAVLEAEATGEREARLMKSVADGLLGLLALSENDPNAALLADSLEVSLSGKIVTLNLSLQASEVIAFIEAEEARKQAYPKK